MSAPILNSLSPSSATPGTVIACAGSGFMPGARVGAPAFAPTTYVSASQVTFACPEMKGAPGSRVQVGVWVANPDGTVSGAVVLTVVLAADRAQGWTTAQAVAAEVPTFQFGGAIGETTVKTWIVSIAQAIEAAMLRRGLPLDPAAWQQPGLSGGPAPSELLELINRTGAAAKLAAAVGAQFGSGDWALTRTLNTQFSELMKALNGGEYDKIFRPAAATVESGPAFAAGDLTDDNGDVTTAFTKTRKF